MDGLSSLCRACGLCCDGSLFGRARLEPDEVDAARRHRLAVVDNGTTFEQPCTALCEGACTVYDARPRACRSFLCRLHERARVDAGSIAPHLARVRRVRELLRRAAESGIVEPELERMLDEDFARA